jgi:hypothetical protein
MKKYFFLMLMILVADASAQWHWEDPTAPHWIKIANNSIAGDDENYTVLGGTNNHELDVLHLASIGSGRYDFGYFTGPGDVEIDPSGWGWIVFDHPGGITPEDVYGDRRNFLTAGSGGDCGCNEMPGSPSIDSLILADEFSFWRNNTTHDPCIWGINECVFTKYTLHLLTCLKKPCPEHGPIGLKLTIRFADSFYDTLQTGAILSGDSPLYIWGQCYYGVDSFKVAIKLENSSRQADSVMLHPIGNYIFHGMYPNSLRLGLESYNTAVVVAGIGDKQRDQLQDEVPVCLPWIMTSRDTVFIRSDSMKIRADLKTSLLFFTDSSSDYIDPNSLVQVVGYQYKSKWTANANQAPSLRKTYSRQYPLGPYYKWWDNQAAQCAYTFKRDSLYAVGGLLSILARGAIKPVRNIDNSFSITTDTFLAHDTLHTDSIATRRILIDHDPPNSAFSAYFTRDRIRAVAWNEYAGSNDGRHCHYPTYNQQWNHYWDDRIYGSDTCHDSKTPCENADINSTATGIMQFLRGDWEKVFNGTNSSYPVGYDTCSWDSLAWNWKKCIKNGTYIHDIYYPAKFTGNQNSFPDSCPYSNCGISPKKKNKDDLKTFGYTAKFKYFKAIQTDADWDTYIANATTREALYVKDVREYNYQLPW